MCRYERADLTFGEIGTEKDGVSTGFAKNSASYDFGEVAAAMTLILLDSTKKNHEGFARYSITSYIRRYFEWLRCWKQKQRKTTKMPAIF